MCGRKLVALTGRKKNSEIYILSSSYSIGGTRRISNLSLQKCYLSLFTIGLRHNELHNGNTKFTIYNILNYTW